MTVQPNEDVRPADIDGDEVPTYHLTCCVDWDVALCGADVSALEFIDFDLTDPAVCRHCKRLDEEDPGPACHACPREVLDQIPGGEG